MLPVPRSHFFVGPTLVGLKDSLLRNFNSAELHPPIKRGDVKELANNQEPGTIIIVDGYFHQSLSVGHAEIRKGIECGWDFWGLSSMGAIRAYEMRNHGMKGFGKIYKMFLDKKDFQDDEVALLHLPESPYTPMTEPMVHLRCAIKDMQKRNLLNSRYAASIVRYLKSMWYGARTVSLLREFAIGSSPGKYKREIEKMLLDFSQYRLKTIDLETFLIRRMWTNRLSRYI